MSRQFGLIFPALSSKAWRLTSPKKGSAQSIRTDVLVLLLAGTFIGLNGCQSTPENDLSDYSSMVSNKSGFNASDPKKIAEVRTSMAAEYIKKNDLDTAVRQLEKALSANKDYAPAYDMMGVLLQREGSRLNLLKADEYFSKAIELDPDFMQAHNNYGVYLSKMERYPEAVKQFEIAGSALGYRGRIGALENLGLSALKIGDTDLATQAFVRALEGNRDSLIAHIELTDLLIEKGRVVQAQNLYEETLVILGDNADKVPRILLQGIKLAHLQNNLSQQDDLSRQLLADFPLSQEAKTLKGWIRNPEATWK